MTTTAEKIKVMQAFEDGLKIQLRGRGRERWEEVITTTLHWNWEAFEYRIEPADPEPLECWANMYDDLAGETYATEKEASREERASHPHKTVHMREVTPQDEQDRLDAARYRKSKELRRQLCETAATNWDAIIDKAIKDQ